MKDRKMKHKLNVNMIKQHNRRSIFNEIISNAPMSRLSISRNLHLSPGTIATVVEELINRGIIREVKDIKSSIGRKPNIIEFLPDRKKIICIDMATRNFSFSLKNLSLKSEYSYKYHFDKSKSYETNFRSFLEEMRKRAITEDKLPGIIGIGVSVPGPYGIDDDKISCKLIPEVTKIKPFKIISGYYNGPVLIDHDVKLAAASEVNLIPDYDHKIILYLYLDEGVGSAISVNGNIYTGANEFAGEIGQIITGETKFEELVSWNTFLIRLGLITDRAQEAIDLKSIKDEYERGEQGVLKELKRIIRITGKLLSNIICVLNPHSIILGGKYKIFGNKFIISLQRETEKYLIEDLKRNLSFHLSSHQERGPLIGAGKKVRDFWLDNN